MHLSLRATQGFPQDVRFPGQFLDSEVGGYYNYQRYYDPATGRYLTSDPIGLDGGINTHSYALGNPLTWFDPDGLTATRDCRRNPRTCGRPIFEGGNAVHQRPARCLTPRAARRQVMRDAGIPTSQQPIAQQSPRIAGSGTPVGRQYTYEIPRPGGGTQRHSVQHSLTDRVKGHGPHWEAGPVKSGRRVDPAGRPRLQEGAKRKVEECGLCE